MSIETDSKIYPALNQIYTRIENNTHYPDTLVNTGRQGSVQLQFEVDQSGVLTGQFFSINSEDKYLTVHVLRILKKTLSQPLNSNLKLPVNKIRLVVNFHFGIFIDEFHFPKKNIPILKNVFHIYKYIVRDKSPIKLNVTNSGRMTLDLDLIKSIDMLIKMFSPDQSEDYLESYKY